MSNKTTYKTGQNQSGMNLPHTGKLAFAHSAAHIASNCVIVDEWPVALKFRIQRMRFQAEWVAVEIAAYRATGVQE